MKSIAGRTYTKIWKLNSTLLNNQWLGQRRNYFHENEKTIYQNLWNAKTNNNHHLAACIKYNVFYVFQQREKPSYLLFPKNESTKENPIQAEYLTAQEVLSENKTNVFPPPPYHQETLQMTRGNTTEENTVSACQLNSVGYLIQLPICQELENYSLFPQIWIYLLGKSWVHIK